MQYVCGNINNVDSLYKLLIIVIESCSLSLAEHYRIKALLKFSIEFSSVV